MIKSFVEITIKAMKWGCFLREDPIFLYAGHATDLCERLGPCLNPATGGGKLLSGSGGGRTSTV
jgi:hypothetical protein